MIWIIHNNEINNISEPNVLHDILNPYKHVKTLLIITISYIDVWIHAEVNQSIKIVSYYIVDKASKL